MGKGTSVDEGQEVWFLSFSKYSSLVPNVHLCVCVCVGRHARLWREGEPL